MTDPIVGGPRPHTLLRPGVAIPFLLVSLIWGSTWWVITGQIADVPPLWSVAWRFMIAAPAMFALAAIMRRPLAMRPPAHLLAIMMGLFQFCVNYVLVYHSELHVTSGIVAVMISLMIIPNAVLGWLWLGVPITRQFALGSLIAIVGIVLLLLEEIREARLGGDVVLGIWLALGAMLGASISNVIQAGKIGRKVPLVSLLAWAMLYGMVFDVALAFAVSGVPTFPTSLRYWGGIAYLAIIGSVVTFPLYYGLVREIGPGRAAYHTIMVVIVAMLLSTVLEGYSWSGLAIEGASLALIGLIIALRARKLKLR